MNWNNIDLETFEELQKVLKIEDETERMLAVSELIFGDDVTDLPLAEYTKKMKELSFLQNELPTDKMVKTIKIDGREYVTDCLLGNISTAQYIDYTNHLKTGDMSKIMSVFFIPKGHKYNDGYDMMQVFNDMKHLPIDVVNSAAFFFTRQLATFIKIFQSSLRKSVQKMEIPKEKKKEILKAVETLESYHLFSNLLK